MPKLIQYTCKMVAEILGVTPARVRHLAINRNLGHMVGSTKVFTAAEVQNMKVRKAGRPAKKGEENK